MTEERLEKLYWELDELEANPWLLDWSADDIKNVKSNKNQYLGNFV